MTLREIEKKPHRPRFKRRPTRRESAEMLLYFWRFGLVEAIRLELKRSWWDSRRSRK